MLNAARFEGRWHVLHRKCALHVIPSSVISSMLKEIGESTEVHDDSMQTA